MNGMSRNMRSVNTMIVGILLAAAPGLMAQTSPAGGAQTNPPAKAASKSKGSKSKSAAKTKTAAPGAAPAASGDFYVDEHECTSCGVPAAAAPDLIRHRQDTDTRLDRKSTRLNSSYI